MRITDVETFIVGNPWKNWLFIRLRTDEGVHGIAEATLNAFAKTVEACIHELKSQFIGLDPFQPELISRRMFRDVYSDGGQIHKNAVASVEIACWDIIGKSLNVPVYKLMGGQVNRRIRAYANGWYRGPRTPESFGEKAREVVGRGYTALKFDPFGDAWRSLTPREFQLSLDIIGAVREAVGPDVDVLVEGHSRFSGSTALQLAEAMARYRPTWFEEPVPHQNISA
ncbi:mandelate racemase/muconate lactonizing enzyme family protein, partial [bacterium]|nr:mandelate racemase/muconate lactonizing enzyme family protein [bacterium]